MASADSKRMKSLGITYEGEAKSLGFRVQPVKELKKGQKIEGGGFFGHRGDMKKHYPSDKDLAKATYTGKIYDKPSITRDLEDN